MAIDPMMYQRLSGRSGDPYDRLGAALAKNAKAKQERDALPKGVSGGLRNIAWPGLFANFWLALKVWRRGKDD
jgi:hypothetical protein